ncbi:MAG TPA: twin-arginine translocase TatA/TatE family subunit [Verrucomicrobiae bacterium]|nr:twin-arginine translocase TatA/TatE family subunit [Verrucomicrobiae bacterium]
MLGSLGAPELLAILVVVLVVFGPGKLPKLGKSLAEAIQGFKNAIREPDHAPTSDLETAAKRGTTTRS